VNETPRALLQKLRKTLIEVADISKAPAMRAYMKSTMPYHGVPAPVLRKTFREVFGRLSFGSAEDWQSFVLYIWRNAKFREERYAALALCELRCVHDFQTLDAVPMYEELIVTGAWWDYVDVLASHCLGELLRRHPREMSKKMKEWSRSDSLWKRRSAILCQLQFKKDTDLKLLYACIAPSMDSTEFFLRKAIGWALRQYAWTDPVEIHRYVREHDAALSPLSKREALKNKR
jgi:3-methyladenine DNA glycosylase AlkD